MKLTIVCFGSSAESIAQELRQAASRGKAAVGLSSTPPSQFGQKRPFFQLFGDRLSTTSSRFASSLGSWNSPSIQLTVASVLQMRNLSLMKLLNISTVQFALSLPVLLASLGLGACATIQSSSTEVAEDFLVGTWRVDLRPTPDVEPYFKEFVVTSVQGNSFSGRFYDSPISQGRINADWGKLRIAFMTADESGPYHHSAILEGNKLEGLSNSTGRNFLAYWSAVKQ